MLDLETDILCRLYLNSAMTISAVMVMFVFAYYLTHAWWHMHSWRRFTQDIATRAAFAILLWAVGRVVWDGLRVADSVLDYVDKVPISPTPLLPFVAASAIILLGKLLVIYSFASEWCRWPLVATTTVLSLSVPAVEVWWLTHLSEGAIYTLQSIR